MHLMHADKLFQRRAERRRGARAVLGCRVCIVMRAGACVEARIDAAGDAASASEEGMLRAAETLSEERRWCVGAQKPAGGGRFGLDRHMTLNSAPISSSCVK